MLRMMIKITQMIETNMKVHFQNRLTMIERVMWYWTSFWMRSISCRGAVKCCAKELRAEAALSFLTYDFPAFRKAVLIQPYYRQLGALFLYSKEGEAELSAISWL